MAELRAVRDEVFVGEQNVPVELEHDALDPLCTHVIARLLDGTPVGTGRLTPERHIGRMAVRAPWRGRGIGDALLLALVEQARLRGWP
ncbi:MAG: GNAT family N-acetyltransferase, partial [Thermomonas sp.]